MKLTRKPDLIIGKPSDPYMLRWHLIPRNRFFNIYLHKILKDDDDRALHDHPWAFISIMLKGSYVEIRKGRPRTVRRAPSIALRSATTLHRIQLYPHLFRAKKAVWTLVFTGPRIREWGFACPQGWIPWQVFTAIHNKGEIGRGCD